jgi:hypothetical protein
MREQCESYFARALNFHGVVSSTPTLFCMKVAYLHSVARFFPPRPCKMCYCNGIFCVTSGQRCPSPSYTVQGYNKGDCLARVPPLRSHVVDCVALFGLRL